MKIIDRKALLAALIIACGNGVCAMDDPFDGTPGVGAGGGGAAAGAGIESGPGVDPTNQALAVTCVMNAPDPAVDVSTRLAAAITVYQFDGSDSWPKIRAEGIIFDNMENDAVDVNIRLRAANCLMNDTDARLANRVWAAIVICNLSEDIAEKDIARTLVVENMENGTLLHGITRVRAANYVMNDDHFAVNVRVRAALNVYFSYCLPIESAPDAKTLARGIMAANMENDAVDMSTRVRAANCVMNDDHFAVNVRVRAALKLYNSFPEGAVDMSDRLRAANYVMNDNDPAVDMSTRLAAAITVYQSSREWSETSRAREIMEANMGNDALDMSTRLRAANCVMNNDDYFAVNLRVRAALIVYCSSPEGPEKARALGIMGLKGTLYSTETLIQQLIATTNSISGNSAHKREIFNALKTVHPTSLKDIQSQFQGLITDDATSVQRAALAKAIVDLRDSNSFGLLNADEMASPLMARRLAEMQNIVTQVQARQEARKAAQRPVQAAWNATVIRAVWQRHGMPGGASAGAASAAHAGPGGASGAPAGAGGPGGASGAASGH